MTAPNPASTAQVPPAAAPASAAPAEQPKPAEGTPAPAATPAAAPAAATPSPAATPAAAPAAKDGAAAEPAPATKKDEPKPADGAPTVPLKSEDFKLPEGSLLDPAALPALIEFANAKKMSKEDAQAMLEHESKAVSSYVEGEKAKATQMEEQWYEASKSDKEIGGEAYDANVELGNRVLKKFGTPGFEKLLQDSRAHLHPEVQRFIIRIGKAMNPAELVTEGAGDGAGVALPRLADRMYTGGKKKADPAAAA